MKSIDPVFTVSFLIVPLVVSCVTIVPSVSTGKSTDVPTAAVDPKKQLAETQYEVEQSYVLKIADRVIFLELPSGLP